MKNSKLPKRWHWSYVIEIEAEKWIVNATKFVGIEKDTAMDIYHEVVVSDKTEDKAKRKAITLIKKKKYDVCLVDKIY